MEERIGEQLNLSKETGEPIKETKVVERNVLAEILQRKFPELDNSKKITIGRLTEELLTGLSPEQITRIQQDENLQLGFWRQIVDNLNRSEEGKQLLAEISKKVGPGEIDLEKEDEEIKNEPSKLPTDEEILGQEALDKLVKIGLFIEDGRELSYPTLAEIDILEKEKPESYRLEGFYQGLKFLCEFVDKIKENFNAQPEDKKGVLKKYFYQALKALLDSKGIIEGNFSSAFNQSESFLTRVKNICKSSCLIGGSYHFLKDLNQKYSIHWDGESDTWFVFNKRFEG